MPTQFKNCPNCGMIWLELNDFLEDPDVSVIGYQANFNHLSSGLFLFNHCCGTTLACQVEQFAYLYNGPIYTTCRTGEPDCPGLCLHQSDLALCPVQCSCAYVREILALIRSWPKQ
jgi:hypothetical protein